MNKFKVGDYVRINENGAIKQEELKVLDLFFDEIENKYFYFVKRRRYAIPEDRLVKVMGKKILKQTVYT